MERDFRELIESFLTALKSILRVVKFLYERSKATFDAVDLD